VGTVEHRSTLSVLTILAARRTSHWSSCSVGTIDSVRGNKSSLGTDRVEQALLVEANAVLATSVRRAVIA
jgi:hypothetical protein